MTTQLTSIDPRKSLNELIEEHPETLEVFHRFGFDICCGGTIPLVEVAERHGVDLQAILGAIAAQHEKQGAVK